MKNTLINRTATKKIAHALGELNNDAVFVGGAVVSLYIDDKSADDVRPTKDIDISLEITSFGELERIRKRLEQKGFYQSHEDKVVCRFRFEDIKVDVMSTKEVGWAPANQWFESGFKDLIEVEIDDITVRCLSLPYFLATKFTAFENRGGEDPRTSHDFEDIVYILNHTSTLKNQILSSENKVKNYLIHCFNKIIENRNQQEAILGNLFHENQDYRFTKIMNTLKEICSKR
ncbi:nucleotidyl transferase AbiEii/AbiGii toxin family protein [Brumimicrobium oceani]|uniref:Nucleotidyl transferase AbiEii/AbiGii toxin family protein n=1 Tax=Brumimicrobium oceani TaxID=2100725 RepID=A0A2U2XER8_9FLAO|nr:nucleotidyl transferase AbiEii/AbiGii toxin family protein [Brumimicrobium oceani]PWH86285.1 hypothetical protein DIT68_03335 [Brumimicrobium oceani]